MHRNLYSTLTTNHKLHQNIKQILLPSPPENILPVAAGELFIWCLQFGCTPWGYGITPSEKGCSMALPRKNFEMLSLN